LANQTKAHQPLLVHKSKLISQQEVFWSPKWRSSLTSLRKP